jgi:imidazolonepropionase-like amidohydrolase
MRAHRWSVASGPGVHRGVCTVDALASATALAATACGVGDRKGRLAADFAADLLLVDGDPLAISLPSEPGSRLLARPPRYVSLRGRSAGRRARHR